MIKLGFEQPGPGAPLLGLAKTILMVVELSGVQFGLKLYA